MKSTVTFKAFLKKLIEKFSRDETTTLAASLAFYTALSVAPILILFVAITSKLKFSVTKLVLEKSQETLGTEATVIIKNIIDNSKQQPDFASIASWVSIIFLLLSASLVFGQIQMALNKIFKEKMPCEDQQDGTAILVCLFLKQKVFYAISVLGFIVLLIATVGVSSLIFSYFDYNNVFLGFFIRILSSLFIYTSVSIYREYSFCRICFCVLGYSCKAPTLRRVRAIFHLVCHYLSLRFYWFIAFGEIASRRTS